jgi:serine/threonine protein kinase
MPKEIVNAEEANIGRHPGAASSEIRLAAPPVIPGYEIQAELGRGGMGVVYKARQLSLNRPVALKVICSDGQEGPEVFRRFERETRAAALLSHPNIVAVYDAGRSGNLYYLAMQFIEGTDLARLVEQSGPLPIEAACNYIRQAAAGLQHAFEQGLVHRDIKPANLMVGEAEAGPLPNREVEAESFKAKTFRQTIIKILDLGLARLDLPGQNEGSAASLLTQEGMIMGTPDFVAPEQVENSHAVDIRADLFSLGCTFFFLLSGNVPFPGRTSLEKLDRLRWGRPRPLERLRRDVPDGVAAIVRKLMAKNPQERYQTPAELMTALDAAVKASTEKAQVRPGGIVPAGQGAADTSTGPTTVAKERDFLAEFNRLQNALAGLLERNALLEAQGIVVAMLAIKPKDSVALAAQVFVEDQLHPKPVGECGRFEDHGHWLWSVAFSPDGSRAITGSGDKLIHLWDLAAGKKIRCFTGHREAVKCVAFAPDGNRVLSGGKDKTIRLWDAESGKVLRGFLRHTDAVESVTFAPQGRRLLSASRDKSVRLWDVESGQRLRHFRGHTGDVKSAVFSADGKSALSGSWDHTVRLWDVESGRQIRCLNCHMNLITSVALSPDGRRVLAGGSDNFVYLWNLNNDQEPRRWEGHTNLVSSVAFSPDGKRALSASNDQTIRLWDVERGREIMCLAGHANWVTCVVFSPDGRYALSGSADKSMRLWRLPP